MLVLEETDCELTELRIESDELELEDPIELELEDSIELELEDPIELELELVS